jgi:hypothetical protein
METIYNIDPSILAAAERASEAEYTDENGEELTFGEKMAKHATKVSTKARATVKVAKEKTQRVTKGTKATEIYRQFNGDKALVIAAYMDQLSMSKAGATTYFYNAKKVG